MDNKDNKKKEPWKVIIGVVTNYATIPKEQVGPLIATTIYHRCSFVNEMDHRENHKEDRLDVTNAGDTSWC